MHGCCQLGHASLTHDSCHQQSLLAEPPSPQSIRRASGASGHRSVQVTMSSTAQRLMTGEFDFNATAMVDPLSESAAPVLPGG